MTQESGFQALALGALIQDCSDAMAIFLCDPMGSASWAVRTIGENGAWEGALVDREELASYLKRNVFM